MKYIVNQKTLCYKKRLFLALILLKKLEKWGAHLKKLSWLRPSVNSAIYKKIDSLTY